MSTPVIILCAALAGLAAGLLTGRLRSTVARDARLVRSGLHIPLATLGGGGAALVAASWFEVIALGILAVICALLVVVDLAEHRLPNALVGPAYPLLVASLAFAALVDDDWPRLGGALLAGAMTLTAFLVLAAIDPAGLGMGDVKLSGLLGIALGWFGWQTALLGITAAVLLNGLLALVVRSVRRGRGRPVPFGPSLIAGAALGLAETLA